MGHTLLSITKQLMKTTYVSGLSFTHSSNPHQHIWTLLVAVVKDFHVMISSIVLVLLMEVTVLFLLLAVTITVNQDLSITPYHIIIISMIHCGTEQDV